MLVEKEVVDKLHSALFPSELADEMRSLKTAITRLHESLDAKDRVINGLKVCVVGLEENLDDTEQYSRRSNLRIHGCRQSQLC